MSTRAHAQRFLPGLISRFVLLDTTNEYCDADNNYWQRLTRWHLRRRPASRWKKICSHTNTLHKSGGDVVILSDTWLGRGDASTDESTRFGVAAGRRNFSERVPTKHTPTIYIRVPSRRCGVRCPVLWGAGGEVLFFVYYHPYPGRTLFILVDETPVHRVPARSSDPAAPVNGRNSFHRDRSQRAYTCTWLVL